MKTSSSGRGGRIDWSVDAQELICVRAMGLPLGSEELTMKSGPALILMLGLALFGSASAAAQSMNRPYVPGGFGGGTGFSLAGRQAILNEEFTGSRPNVLIRGPNGGLVDLLERDNNAFLPEPGGGNFLPGARPGKGWPTGLGTGLGWNNAGYGSGGSGSAFFRPPASSLNGWIALIPAGLDEDGAGGGYVRSGGTPIDTWISQLNLL